MPPSEPLSTASSFADRSPFRLGPWRVVPAELRLVQGDLDLRLQPKEMALLLALCEGDRRPMSAEQVRQLVWGDQAITDGAAKNLVWQLRNSLGETARSPRLIQTVPGVGYRLAVEVEAIESPAGESVETSPVPLHPTPESAPGSAAGPSAGRRWRWLWGMLGLVGVLFVLWLGEAAKVPVSEEPENGESEAASALVARPVTGLPGREAKIELDPTGRHLLFSWLREINGPADLYRFDLQDEKATPLRLTENEQGWEVGGRFSPDGRRIAFVAYGPEDGVQIHVMPASGGAAKVIATIDSATEPQLDWRADGEALFLTWRPVIEAGHRMHVLPLATGRPEPLFDEAAEIDWDRSPSVSPDGSRVAFSRWTSAYRSELRLLHVASGDEVVVASIVGRFGTLDWQEDGQHLLFTARLAGHSSAIYRVPADGSSEPALFAPTAGLLDVGEVASAAGMVAIEQSDFDVEILRFDGLDGPEISAPQWVASSDRTDLSPRLSPDGRRLAFLTDRSGGFELWLSEDGSSRKLHVEGVVPASSPRWSPDGQLLALSVLVDGQQNLVVVRPGDRVGHDHVELITETPEREILPSWRPDGLALRFYVPGQSSATLWEQGLWDPQSRRPLAPTGEATLALSQDRLLFSAERGALFLLDLTSAAGPKRLEIDIGAAGWGNWDATENGVYWAAVGSHQVRFYRFADGSVHDVVELEGPASLYCLDVSADGSSLFVSVVVRDSSRILTLEGVHS